MGDLGPIDCERRRGDQPFHNGGRALGLDLLSFWQWSTSDVVSSTIAPSRLLLRTAK